MFTEHLFHGRLLFFLFAYVFLLDVKKHKKQTSINKSLKKYKRENIFSECENDETVVEKENLRGQEKENSASCAVSPI